ncbi:uncharacterized protein LOC135934747 [Cloeon dipterum]|uniref:uncharacterized protein LOC135934747 n=1 Tax=Cloeon dipterum TaxID=197152 RepID=UPI00322029E1
MWSAIFGSSEPVFEAAGEVSFSINGSPFTADEKIASDMTLNSFIRDLANLKGTKFMCYEGGCGACVVSATVVHPVTKMRQTLAVNSCLTPIFACHGWDITTVEGVGDRRKGYHAVQTQLAKFNGTQCGYCSPGMVMSMYSLLERGKAPSKTEVEDSFGSNLCRCTGYRPILDAFKSLASDSSLQGKTNICVDIEDMDKMCPNKNEFCSKLCGSVVIQSGSAVWRKVATLDELVAVLAKVGDAPYKLVAGNTAEGIYRSEGIQTYIDVKSVPQLRNIEVKPDVITLGGNVTLTEAMDFFNEVNTAGFDYLVHLGDHFDLVAHVPVRNVGTLAGNLSIKHAHPDFPSDVFMTLDAVGATLNIMDISGIIQNVTMVDFLLLGMNKKIILSIQFTRKDNPHRLRLFKITPRAQNAHAYVNAGFFFEFEDEVSWKVASVPRIVFGGISPTFTHARAAESLLVGKVLLDNKTLAQAITALGQEILPDDVLTNPTPDYRRKLAQSLFYKFVLHLDPTKVSKFLRSGTENLQRPLSSGIQEFDTDATLYPLNEAIPKIEALAQCSGEAQYVNDIPSFPDELHGAFVQTTVATGTISSIDATAALAIDGVVAFYKHTDMPYSNTFTPASFGYLEPEEVFCSGTILYAGQAVGMIVAKSRGVALEAAKKVKIEYAVGSSNPVLTVEDVLNQAGNRIYPVQKENEKDSSMRLSAAKIIKGDFSLPRQYHMTMETQTCLVVPREDDNYDVFCSTQFMDLAQAVVAKCLNVEASKINMSVRRLGGGYGGKITRPPQLAAACAVASWTLNKPVRMVLPLSGNMEIAGKRFAVRDEYEVGVDEKGKIVYLKAKVFQDAGCNLNDSQRTMNTTIAHFTHSVYDSSTFEIVGQQIKTDTASNTWCRGPGSTEAVAFLEEIMERIAGEMNLDPLEVRLANMYAVDNPVPAMIADLKEKADYDARKAKVEEFNSLNRWKKRGVSLVPVQYPFDFWGVRPVVVSVYQIDGSVAISHGGVEMGQGLNTKVAQVAAHFLGLPLSMISIKPSNNLVAANASVTGASLGSESLSYATMQCCKEILSRLSVIKEKMPDAEWKALVREAHAQEISLTASYTFTKRDNVGIYFIWGAAMAEMEVDILTGEKQILRVDLLEDAGQSMSPMVDVGQMEGAFVMGLGYWLYEELVYDHYTGRLLTNSTWNYKIPGAKDIPADFRVYFRKNSKNPNGVLNSKATGEPPLNMSIAAYFAITHALNSARKDAGAPAGYFQLKPPATAEHIFITSLTDEKDFKLFEEDEE